MLYQWDPAHYQGGKSTIMVVEIRRIWTGLGALLFVWNVFGTCIILRRELQGIEWTEPFVFFQLLPYMIVSLVLFGILIGLMVAEQVIPDPWHIGFTACTYTAAKSTSQFPAARSARTNYGTMDEKDLL
jgi:hypothetical protein